MELCNDTGDRQIDQDKVALQRLQAAYEGRFQYWRRVFSENRAISEELDRSFASATKFYKLIEDGLFPLMEEGKTEEARKLVNGPLRETYNLHRLSIDRLVSLARQKDGAMQRSAQKLISSRTWIQYLWEIVTLSVIVVPIIWVMRSEKKLLQSESSLRTIVENSSDVIFGVSVDNQGEFTCNSVNPAALRLGLQREDFVSSRHTNSPSVSASALISDPSGQAAESSLVSPEVLQLMMKNYGRCVRLGTSINFEQQLTTPAGSLWLNTLLVPLKNDQGEVIQIIGIGRNISSLKSDMESMQNANSELERRVSERTKELESACRELESFSYSVSHDLRSPLRAINGFSHALIADFGASLDVKAQQCLGRIQAASERMGQIIDDLLLLAQVTRSTLTLKKVNLAALASKIIEDLRHSDLERNVTFICHQEMEGKCDLRLIQSVLENLLGNAWKYTSRHLQATIEFGVETQGRERVFFIKDDGAGFDMLYQEKLFQNFQRLHDPCEFEGTGIGLAIVARIIHRHQGRIWAFGEVEKGATFYFTLPD